MGEELTDGGDGDGRGQLGGTSDAPLHAEGQACGCHDVRIAVDYNLGGHRGQRGAHRRNRHGCPEWEDIKDKAAALRAIRQVLTDRSCRVDVGGEASPGIEPPASRPPPAAP